MAITVSFLLLFFSLLPTSLSTPVSHHFSKIYAFGDSYTDTGNTRSATGPSSFTSVSQPPYGITFFHHSTNRYSDGRLVVDFLATKLSLPFLPPYLNRTSDFSHGVNFAVAGSTAIDHQFFLKNNLTLDITPQSLSTQLVWFDKFLEERGCRAKGSPQCRAAFKDALFWVGEIGANDYAYSIGSSVMPDTIRELAVKTVGVMLQVCAEIIRTLCILHWLFRNLISKFLHFMKKPTISHHLRRLHLSRTCKVSNAQCEVPVTSDVCETGN